MEFEKIKAKVCPNVECKQIIPETWTVCYEINYCPKCGYGYDEKKIEQWRNSNVK